MKEKKNSSISSTRINVTSFMTKVLRLPWHRQTNWIFLLVIPLQFAFCTISTRTNVENTFIVITPVFCDHSVAVSIVWTPYHGWHQHLAEWNFLIWISFFSLQKILRVSVLMLFYPFHNLVFFFLKIKNVSVLLLLWWFMK